MNFTQKISSVSQSPTMPKTFSKRKKFDIADLYSGPIATNDVKKEDGNIDYSEKIRKAYFWITNNAIITPFYDIEYNVLPSAEYFFSNGKSKVTIPTDQSYSSFVLLPLLTLITKKKCLFIGGPGRGKTASAILMGILAGYSLTEVKRAIQHGQPQMTISDLLGNPLPSDLINAQSMENIRIAWRKWLGMKVKIIDEYNRIPTRTQSALLTVMADNYAELLDQIYQCPDSAWYLTANDDAGGGTYQVIEALRDRIDVVVRALHFNSRFLKNLLIRIENNIKPEEMAPKEIVFNDDEIDAINKEIMEVELPNDLLRRLEFFASQFELLESAAFSFEYKTKDNAKVSGVELSELFNDETGKDKIKEIGFQTKNGFSVRAYFTILTFVKAIAYFRGEKKVSFEDVRNIIPFVLHDKLIQDKDNPFFGLSENSSYKVDYVSWIRKLFDLSNAEYDKLGLDKNDTVGDLLTEFEKGLSGVTEKEASKKIVEIEKLLTKYSSQNKLYAHLYDDILTLKYLHQRYSNYLRWLEWSSRDSNK
ncbi:MAG TPA: AAA family ATPase [Spirochaetota bacterium]|nr:AAA family ATPase [Spirochaetota bacterium]